LDIIRKESLVELEKQFCHFGDKVFVTMEESMLGARVFNKIIMNLI